MLLYKEMFSSVTKLMKFVLVFFNIPDKTCDVLDVSKKFMIKVLVTFRSVTQTRINTCYFSGIMNLHGSAQIYVYIYIYTYIIISMNGEIHNV